MLLLIGGQVDAQATPTPTGAPVFSTATPGATPTAQLSVEVIRLDFRLSDQFFTAGDGSRVSGEGWQPDAGSLSISGNGNEYFIERAVIGYRSSEGVSISWAMAYDAVSVAGGGGTLASCPGCTSFSLIYGGAIDDISIEGTGLPSDFRLMWIDLYALTGESEDEYEVDEEGCPILDPEQIAELDPVYFARCSHCFTEPTPVREHQISTVVGIPTFEIPLDVSGTPFLGPGSTSTPAPTATTAPTATPTGTPEAGWCYTWDFTEGSGGWYVTPSTAGEYETGVGFNDTYPPGFDGIYMTSPDWVDTGHVTRLVVYTDLLAGEGLGHFLIRESDSLEEVCNLGGELTEDEDLELWAYGFNCDNDLTTGEALEIVYDCGIGTNCDTDISIVRVHISGEDGESPTGVSFCDGGSEEPTATPTATGTYAPWLSTPDTSSSSCEVASWRDDTPMVSFDPTLNIYDYACYTLIPDITLEIPGRGDVGVDGVELCVTWFQMPVIEVLGFVVSLDWLLIAVIAWLITRLLSF